jgi:hypothetical protein
MVAGIPLRMTTVKLIVSEKMPIAQCSAYLKMMRKKFRIPVAILIIAAILGAKSLADYFHFQSWIAIPLIVVVTLLDLYFQILSACLQGAFDWKRLGVVTILSPLLKLVLAVTCLKAGQVLYPGVPLEIWPATGLLLSTFAVNCLAANLIPKSAELGSVPTSGFAGQIFSQDMLLLTAINLGFAALIQIDSIVGNVVLPEEEKGSFAVLCLMGKIFLYLITAASPLVFSYRAKGAHASIVKPALLVTAALGLLALPAAYFAGPSLAAVFFGASYRIEPGMLVLWLILYTILSAIHILVMEISAMRLSSNLYAMPVAVVGAAMAAVEFCRTSSDIWLAIAVPSVLVMAGMGYLVKMHEISARVQK